MRRTRFLLAIALLALTLPAPSVAQGEKQIKIVLEFRQSGVETRDALQGSGGIVIHRRGGVQPHVGLDASSTETRTRRSTGIFTLVQDGGSSLLNVATRVPAEQVDYFHDYATGAGYVSSEVVFENVGTALRVGARVLPDDRILVQLTPTISYFSADGSGAIDLIEASSELVVKSGEPVVMGGSTTETRDVTRQILGLGGASESFETTLVLTATLQ